MHQAGARSLGHLPAVAAEPEAGHVGDGVHGAPPASMSVSDGRPVEQAHAGDGGALVVVRHHRPARCRVPMGFDSTSTSPAGAPALVKIRSGCTRPCTARPKIGSSLRIVWPPATTPPASAHDLGGGREDGADRLHRHALGEGRDVEGQHDPPAHGEHVAAGVGGGDGAEVGRVVDEGREEVGGRDQREVVADAVDGGVVERRQARRAARGRRSADQLPHQRRRAVPRPTWRRSHRTTSTR